MFPPAPPTFSLHTRLRRLLPALALLCLAALAGPAGARTLLVPSQYATIQSAINASVNGDTVFLADGTYTGPGNVDLDFGGRNVTVSSQNGPYSTFIDCGGSANANHRGFWLHSGETSAVIRGLTIENGYVYGTGGGINNTSVGLTVQNCILKNNTAVYGGGLYNYNNNGGTLRLMGCAFVGNKAPTGAGGGVFNENYTTGTFSVTRCLFTSNQAPGGAGGGIYNDNAGGGAFTLGSCFLTGNAAGTNGGGVYDVSSGGTSALSDCVFTGNTVNLGGGSGGQGDGLYSNVTQSGTLTLFNCTLTGNSDAASTCLYNTDAGGGTTVLTNDILYGDAGGEIAGSGAAANYCDVQGSYPGTANVATDPQFVSSSNLQLKPGSPCLGAGTATGAPTRTVDAQTRPDPPAIGAYEVAPAGPAPTTTSVTSSLNPSIAGQFVLFTATVTAGSASTSETVTFTVDGVARPPSQVGLSGHSATYLTSTLAVGPHTITATYNGDANYSPSTSSPLTQTVNPHVNPQYVSPAGNDANPGTQALPKLTIQGAFNATLDSDTVIVEDGTYAGPGNVDLDFSGSSLTVTSQNGPATTIIDCGGGANHRAFYLHFGETGAVISGFTLQNGNNSGGGAGVYNANAGLTIQNCVFRNNAATYADGGGIFNGGTLTVTGCTLVGNSAGSGLGGGISNESGTLTVIACTISGNSAGGGGGIFNGTAYNGAVGAGSLTLSDCVLSGNSASGGGYGGGLYTGAYYGANTVTNCTFTANTASTGGGIFSYIGGGGGSTVTLTNDIVYGDSSGDGSGDVSGVFTAVRNCDVGFQGVYPGAGNVDADPLFFSASDLHLQVGSPCLGAGTVSGAPATTIDGKTRPNPPSIGAYEVGTTGTAATTTTLTSSLNPSVVGQAVTFTATVAAGGGNPTGTVTFFVDGVAQAHAPLGGGTAGYSTSSLPGGSRTITASYSGDATFAPGKSPALTQTVGTASTTTALTSSLNPSTYHQQVTFTATVTGTASGGYSPTGTVTFTDATSGTPLGTATLSGGAASLTTSGVSGGSRRIVASYGGDPNFSPSASAALTQAVGPESTTVSLYSSVNPSLSSQSVLFNVVVAGTEGTQTGTVGTPSGTVTFSVDGVAQASAPVTNGYYSSYATSSLPVGSHTITATYNGDTNYAPSTSPPLTQTVNPHVTPQYVSPAGSDSNSGMQASPRLTIQAAINSTLSGDTVIVEDGTYTGPGNVDLGFGGRNITVTSQHGPLKTIIDCQGTSQNNHRAFLIASGESGTVISGLTIQNGYENSFYTGSTGGGIYGFGVVLTVQNCILQFNTAVSGGGLYSGSITNGTNPGISGVTAVNCLFFANSATDGGAFYASTSSGTSALVNCTLLNDTASSAVVYNDASAGGSLRLVNDLLYGNPGTEVTGSNVTATNCDIQGGYAGTGNLNADPLFVSSPNDLHLQAGSPCLGAGTASGAPTTTLDGYTRPSPPSIGAYEAAAGSALPTAVTVSNVSGATGQTVTFSATLKTGAGAALSGKTLTFSVDGTAVGTGVTNSAGTATKPYVIPAALAVGGHTLAAAFAGDAADAASTGTGTLTVAKASTTLSVSAVTGSPGQTTTLKATLKRTIGGTAVAGETISLFVDGTAVGTAVTTSAGLASLSYVIPAGDAVGGSHPVAASFAGDGSNGASTGKSTLTVSKYAASLSAASATGTPGQTVTLSATLKSGSAALSGRTVSFTVDGTVVGTGTTNAAGLATLSYALPAGAALGPHTVTATFAGDAAYLAAVGKGTLTVKNATSLSVASVSGAHGTSVTLSAALTAGGAAPSGKTITFKVDGKTIGSVVTDATGTASLPYPIPATAKTGGHPISASFAGDAGDNTATGVGTLTVG